MHARLISWKYALSVYVCACATLVAFYVYFSTVQSSMSDLEVYAIISCDTNREIIVYIYIYILLKKQFRFCIVGKYCVLNCSWRICICPVTRVRHWYNNPFQNQSPVPWPQFHSHACANHRLLLEITANIWELIDDRKVFRN